MSDPTIPSTLSSNASMGNATTVTINVSDVGRIAEPAFSFDNVGQAVAPMPVSAPPLEEVMTKLNGKSVATKEIKEQFGRMKGAKWFEAAYGRNVMVIGQGGIGSWLSLLLSRLGTVQYTFDMDRYETHNMTGQLVRNNDVGKLKTTAVIEICKMFNEITPVIHPNSQYRSDTYSNDIVMCGLDNMATRTVAFTNWKKHVAEVRKELGDSMAATCFFQDGRLTAEQLQIFNIAGDRSDLMERYEKEALFAEAEGFEGDCTFKQTSHSAAMIASHMVGFYTNWLTNLVTEDPNYTKLPFKFEYIIPFNLTMQDYANT